MMDFFIGKHVFMPGEYISKVDKRQIPVLWMLM